MMKDKYVEYDKKCKKCLEAIVNSNCTKKVIISGPGTGKSYLFQKVSEVVQENGGSKILVLSFINELIDDLAKHLYGIAGVKVSTLHSFALSQLPKSANKFSLNIESIIEEDYEIIYEGKKINFGKILCNLVDNGEDLEFYSRRRKYYNAFGPNCSIYALLKIFEEKKNKIPKFSQIMIDEFQDFNKLEAALIDLLSEKSPILIVGDDDQSLYSFRYANPDEIRYKNNSEEYVSFELPFCRRCPKVIIDSFNCVVKEAKKKGYLKKRVERSFMYLPSEEKDKISNDNPKIIVKNQIQQLAVAYHIEQDIEKIFNPKEKDISILIICSLKKQISDLAKRLKEKGFTNVHVNKKNKNEELIEGFNLLLKDKESNLGWRIVCKYILKDNLFDAVKKSYIESEQKKFKNLLNKDDKKSVESLLTALRKIVDKKQILTEESKKLFDCFGYNPEEIAIQKIKNDLDKNKFIKNKKVSKNIRIKITTILGSKGLTNDYVFIVNCDDRFILDKGKITDENICKFIVALTRVTRRVYIYTSKESFPTFVSWIDERNIKEN
jgi:superfamily I DNA/RNA helicase